MRAYVRLLTGASALALTAASFVGCALAESLPPVVSYTTPSDGSGSAPVAGTISATFTRAMDPATITAGSFIVQQGDAAVTGTVSYAGRTATFTPTAPLQVDTLYTTTITTAARDASGAALPSARVWSFTTYHNPATDSSVLYYAYTLVSPLWTRSSSPGSPGNVSQSYNPVDGSVTLTITGAAAIEDNGFYLYVGTLQYFNSLKVVGAAGTGVFSSNIYLDVDNDGEFFTWTPANVFSGVGGDAYYGGPSSLSDVLTIDPTSTFGPYTLAQIKGGAVPGTSGNTRVAIWVGFSLSSGSQTTQIMSVKVN